MKLFVAALLAITVAFAAVEQSRHAMAADGTATTPRKITDFTLNDHAGAKRSLAEWSDKPVLVVVFLGTECPLAKLYGQKLVEIEKQFAERGVQIVGINSNQQDTLQELAGYGTKFGIKFPLLKDAGAKVADQFGATRTPEAFVLDRGRVIRYQGRIDDSTASVRPAIRRRRPNSWTRSRRCSTASRSRWRSRSQSVVSLGAACRATPRGASPMRRTSRRSCRTAA